MFLIICDNDSSLNILEDKDVIFDLDDGDIKRGDSVTFVHRRKKYTGVVEAHSDDSKVIERKMRELENERMKEKKSSCSDVPAKRTRNAPAVFSPSDQESGRKKKAKVLKNEFTGTNKKVHKVIATIENSPQSRKSDSSSGKSLDGSYILTPSAIEKKKEERISDIKELKELTQKISNSPGKDDLLRQISQLKKQLESKTHPVTQVEKSVGDSLNKSGDLGAIASDDNDENVSPKKSESENKISSDDEFDVESEKGKKKFPHTHVGGLEEIYGETYTEDKMIPLGGNVFCRNTLLDEAEAQSSATSVARKLLIGVFREEFLLKATMTGIAGRCLGREAYQSQKMVCLKPDVLNIIYATTLQIAKKKRWNEEAADPAILKESLKHKLGEMRREKKKNLGLFLKK